MTAAECVANIELYVEKMNMSAKQAVTDFANEVMLVSTENYCPVDTGTLKDSASVEETQNTETEYEVTLSYNTDYAINVHEISTYHHNNPPTACWKFLEKALTESQGKFEEELAMKVRGEL